MSKEDLEFEAAMARLNAAIRHRFATFDQGHTEIVTALEALQTITRERGRLEQRMNQVDAAITKLVTAVGITNERITKLMTAVETTNERVRELCDQIALDRRHRFEALSSKRARYDLEDKFGS